MSDHPGSFARAARAELLTVLLLMVPAIALGSPANFGTSDDEKPIHARWPDNTTIHVYLPTPPTPPGSCANDHAKAGIMRWAAALAQRGITIQFHDNQSPPAGATNAVGVSWVAPGTFGGTDQGEGGANAVDVPGGTAINGGYIKIEKDEACGEGMRNLFMHEFGHALGLADDETAPGQPHNAMDPDVLDPPQGFSPRDSSEMRSLYGCFSVAPPHFSKGALTQSVTLIGDPPTFRYEYVIEWLAGPEIPSFDVTLGGLPSGVAVVALPPGWQVAVPPFYRDCSFTPAATADTRELHFFTTAEGLCATQPSGVFVLESTAPPMPGWASTLMDPEDDGLFEPVPVMVPGHPITGVPPGAPRDGLRWLAPRPHPFHGSTLLRFEAPAAWSSGRVDLFDVNGRAVRVLPVPPGTAGETEVAWDGRASDGTAVRPGAYWARITLDGSSVVGVVVRAR